MATSSTPRSAREIQAQAMVGWVQLTAIAQTPPWRVFPFFHVNPSKAIGPELLLTRRDERLAVKVKTVDAGGLDKLTPNQRADRDDLEAAGFEYVLWTPADQPTAMKRLSQPAHPEPPRPTRRRRTTPKKTNAGDNA